MARRKRLAATFPLFDWADARDQRLRDERRLVARPRRRGSRMAGELAYISGLAAEDCVARDYVRRGHITQASRWRGSAGEVDLIAKDGDGLIFVEVKRADTFDKAAAYLTDRQASRIFGAASEYLTTMPKGQLTPVRLDLALVNAKGEVKIVENAIMM
ncbi:MAG: YraN family protein [Deltaproteobacteria bacterium]